MRGQMYASRAMSQRITSTLMAGALLGCASAFGTTVLTPATNLRDQVASADYVVRGRVLEVQTIEVRAQSNETRHCGGVLTVRADEQFRGRLPSTFKFSSVPMIRVARLEVGQDLIANAKSLQRYSVLRQDFGLDIQHAEQVLTLLKSPEWLISADTFLEQLHQPTLAIFGEQDAVVDWRESIDIYRASFARSGNRDLTIKTFPRADHEMLSPAAGSEPPTYVSGYIDTMIKWLAARNFNSRTDN